MDAICQQNFDWRVCGLHGTSYGKGKAGVLPTIVGKLFEDSLTEATVAASQSILPMRNGLLASVEQLHPELAVLTIALLCVIETQSTDGKEVLPHWGLFPVGWML